MPCLKPSLEQDGNLGPTPLGLETAAPFRPRAALAVEKAGKTQVPSAPKVPALHREAERDTTGNLAFSPSHIRVLEGACKGASQCGNTPRYSRYKP